VFFLSFCNFLLLRAFFHVFYLNDSFFTYFFDEQKKDAYLDIFLWNIALTKICAFFKMNPKLLEEQKNG
jgi:hypothetical protein